MTESISDLEAAVKEAEFNLAEAKAKAAHKPYPQWVEPHTSHVKTAAGGHISVPGFDDHHVDRESRITVLVKDAEEEAKALAAAVTGAV